MVLGEFEDECCVDVERELPIKDLAMTSHNYIFRVSSGTIDTGTTVTTQLQHLTYFAFTSYLITLKIYVYKIVKKSLNLCLYSIAFCDLLIDF